MKRLVLALCTLAVLATPAFALDTPAPAPTSPAAVLSKTYAVTLGDMIASTMTAQMTIVQALDTNVRSPITCTYDRTAQKIVATVYGNPNVTDVWGNSKGVVDQAKTSLEYFRAKVFPVLSTMVAKTYDVTVSESDLTLVYLDRTANMKEVLRREADKYLVSEQRLPVATLVDTLHVVQVVHDTAHVVTRDIVHVVVQDTLLHVNVPAPVVPAAVVAKPHWFFGNLYPFGVIAGVVTLANALYTAYISFLQGARIRLNLGDQIGIVLSPGGNIGRKLHLRCNFANAAAKMGTVQHMEAVVRGPQNFVHRFRWHLFYKYLDGGDQVQKTADVYPLAVAGRDSHLKFIEFDIIGLPDGRRPAWPTGRYTLELEGWVNRAERRASPNVHATYHFTLPEGTASTLRTDADRATHTFIFAPVEEWQTPGSP